ncbi:uncharacterized protein LOC134535404 [Bacillus rossius redtenbacheri]|uniref:uncharacterized protein LOC134535404 n=1 Tax=Bacillus rossius redtenbacheri TaxID=93214 RepID=UPI002FDE15DD
MSGVNKKRSKIKLRVKDNSQKDVFLDVSPDDTFETLQIRAEKEIGLALDLKQFSYCGQRIDPKGNVIEYFRNVCKGPTGGTEAPSPSSPGLQPACGVSPAQMTSTLPVPEGSVAVNSKDGLESLGNSNAAEMGTLANFQKVQDQNSGEDDHGKEQRVGSYCDGAVENACAAADDDDDAMMQVVGSEVEVPQEVSGPLGQDVGTELGKRVRDAPRSSADEAVRPGGGDRSSQGSAAVAPPSAGESMEVETVFVKEEVFDEDAEAQVVDDADLRYEEDLEDSGGESLDGGSYDTDSLGDLADDTDLGRLCRLCGREKSDMVLIFSEEGMSLCLKEKINSWLPMNVKKTDLLPKQVCERCITKVTMCQEFGMQCLRTNNFLQQLVRKKFRCETPADADSQPEYDNSLEPEVKSDAGDTYCCPLCVSGVMKTKPLEEVEEDSEASSSSELEPQLDRDVAATAVVEEDFGKCDRAVVPDDASMDYDESAYLVEAVMDNGLDTAVPEDPGDGGEVSREVALLPDESRPRGRGRGRGRGLSRGARVERGRGRGRGRGRAKTSLQVPRGAGDVCVPCCLCGAGTEGVSGALLHTLLSHSSEPDSYTCSLCGQEAQDRSAVITHFHDAHGSFVTTYERFGDKILLLYECKRCTTVFRSEKTLCGHDCLKKFESDSLKCSKCSKTFVTKARLYFHQQFHWRENTPMTCEMCSLDFGDEDSMYDHFKFSHRGDKYVCSICGIHFNSKTGCYTHEQMHTNKLINRRTFTCDTCSKSFFDKQTLKEHVVSHMETRPYQCHICGRDLSRPSRLKRHLKAHASYNAPPQDIYRCLTCEEVFCSQEKAFEHTQSDQSGCRVDGGGEHEFAKESADKVYRCEFCEKCYSATGVLNYHRKSHMDDPMPYRCHVCGTPHVSFARCATHKVTHGLFTDTDLGDFTVPKYFLCEFCNRYYLHWTYLSVHRRRTHSSVKYLVTGMNVFKPEVPAHSKPFKCDKCGRRYLLEWALEKHQRLQHRGDESSSYQCDHCGKVFSCKKFLEKHLVVHGEKQFACELCDSAFVRASSLAIHVGRVHTASKQHCCEHCGLEFVRRGDLTEHIRTHTGDRPFQCEHCKKRFRTRGIWHQHTRIHRDERPYPCDVCGARFRRSFARNNHMTLHTGVRAFVCEVCGKAFRMHQELTKHLRVRHERKDDEPRRDSGAL